MGAFSKSIILVALLAVGVVLALGFLNLARGGSMSTSQKLMRWRVALQFLAICIIMIAIYFASH
ncbi:MAG: twin transmembrane helix small protein [Rhodomicrobium sp.]